MGKVKEWATAEAENFLDNISAEIKSKKITIKDAIKKCVKNNGFYNFGLVGFDVEETGEFEDQLEEYFNE